MEHKITADAKDVAWYLWKHANNGLQPVVISFYIAGEEKAITNVEQKLLEAAFGDPGKNIPKKNFASFGKSQSLDFLGFCRQQGLPDFYAVVLRDGGNNERDAPEYIAENIFKFIEKENSYKLTRHSDAQNLGRFYPKDISELIELLKP